jgi:hypothetical protein
MFVVSFVSMSVNVTQEKVTPMMTIDITGALAHEHIADLRGTAARYNLAHEVRRNARQDAHARPGRLSRLIAAVRETNECCPAPSGAC